MAQTPTPVHSYTARALSPLRCPSTLPMPANMNGAPVVDPEVLVHTLRHFSEYGLGAASKALKSAQEAFDAGDTESGLHWLEIGRALDRRGAARVERALKASG